MASSSGGDSLEEGVEVLETTEITPPASSSGGDSSSPFSQLCTQMAAFSYDKAKEIAVIIL